LKKIILLSDTHGHIDSAMLRHMKEADEVWHAGDIGSLEVADKILELSNLRAVFGNIDNHNIRSEYPEDNIFKIENTVVWMTHIGGYPKNYATRIKTKLKASPPDIFISGHSHILKVIYDKSLGLLHLNPGAAGKHGFHNVRTMLRFEIHADGIKNLNIIELEKRV